MPNEFQKGARICVDEDGGSVWSAILGRLKKADVTKILILSRD